MLADVNADIDEITEIITSLRSDQKILQSYRPMMEKLPPDSLIRPLWEVMQFETFSEKDNTYATLVASTGLKAFSDHQLVETITEYYSSYTSIRRFEQIYTSIIFELNRFLAPSVIIDQKKIVDKNVTSAPQTRNLLFVTEG